jgi:hypothetical protein
VNSSRGVRRIHRGCVGGSSRLQRRGWLLSNQLPVQRRGLVRSLVHAVLWTVPAVREMAVSLAVGGGCCTATAATTRSAAMPIAEKLVLPQGYGQATETLAWEQVRA